MQVQRPNDTATSTYGSPKTTWFTVATRWASMTPLSGRELFTAMQIQADITHLVRLFYGRDLKGITPKWRLIDPDKGRTLEIISVINIDSLNREYMLYCKETV